MSDAKEEKFSFEAFQKITEEMKEKVINGTILNHMTIGIETFETIVKIVEHKNSQIAILEAALREYSSHKLSCNTKAIEMGRLGISDFTCNCGLDDVLSQAGLSNDKGGV